MTETIMREFLREFSTGVLIDTAKELHIAKTDDEIREIVKNIPDYDLGQIFAEAAYRYKQGGKK